MLSANFIDHSDEVKAVIHAALLQGLEKCGLVGESYAKKLCPVDTGNEGRIKVNKAQSQLVRISDRLAFSLVKPAKHSSFDSGRKVWHQAEERIACHAGWQDAPFSRAVGRRAGGAGQSVFQRLPFSRRPEGHAGRDLQLPVYADGGCGRCGYVGCEKTRQKRRNRADRGRFGCDLF